MSKKETIEYLQQLLHDKQLDEKIKFGIEAAIKQLKKKLTPQEILAVIKDLGGLVSIGCKIYNESR